ncbi:MAG: Crp/Fnr family transcriptional regulator [Saprospiraceae bacterium]|nr:Crp/Fnr family transcriptional regulator [Saprospiraceae bacterium]
MPTCSDCNVLSKSYLNLLDDEDIFNLSINKSCALYKKGQTIFHEGKTPTGIYCLSSGKVKIYKHGKDGKEQIVRFVTPGEFLGIRSILGGKSYSASSTTLEDSVICFITKSDFFNILKKYPKISNQLIAFLSQLLADAENKITSLAQKPVRERLAESLIVLGSVFSDDGNSSPGVITLSREDIANIVGTATETVIRLLSDFKDDNLITSKGRKITLVNIPGLKKIARIYE